jgi:hypothetical protein
LAVLLFQHPAATTNGALHAVVQLQTMVTSRGCSIHCRTVANRRASLVMGAAVRRPAVAGSLFIAYETLTYFLLHLSAADRTL